MDRWKHRILIYLFCKKTFFLFIIFYFYSFNVTLLILLILLIQIHFQVAAADDAIPSLLQGQFSPFCVPHTALENHKSIVLVQIVWYSQPSTRNFRRKTQPSTDTWLLWLHSQSAHWKHWKDRGLETSFYHEILGCHCLHCWSWFRYCRSCCTFQRIVWFNWLTDCI